MITKHEKAKGFWCKLLATLPVLALLLIVNARASAQQVKKTDETVYEFSTKDITDVKIKKVDNDSIYQIVEQMPEFPGGAEKMMKYLSENIKYPEEAKEKGISGRVFLSFVIEKDGSVNQVKVMKGIGGGCDDEAVRVVKAMPKWKPGMQKGKSVRVSYMLPLTFKLDAGDESVEEKMEKSLEKAKKTNDKGVYQIAETMPEFPGGTNSLRDYLQDKLTVPEKYKNMDVKADYRVFVQFVVAEDGSITNVELMKPDPSKQDLNDEALRVVKGMPKWKPGTVDGKPVKVSYMLPVLFKLGK